MELSLICTISRYGPLPYKSMNYKLYSTWRKQISHGTCLKMWQHFDALMIFVHINEKRHMFQSCLHDIHSDLAPILKVGYNFVQWLLQNIKFL